MAPRKPKVEKPSAPEVKSEVASKPPSTPGPSSQVPAPGKRGETKTPKAKRRQGGKGKPFPKGEADKLPGKEHRFKPGQSGNPSGRPKTVKEVQDRINARAFDLVDHLFNVADDVPMELPPVDGEDGWQFKGPTHTERITAIRDLMHVGGLRANKSVVEHSGPDGKPIQTESVNDSDLLMETLKAMEERILKDQAPPPAPADAPPSGPIEAVTATSESEPETEQGDDGTDPA